MRAWNVYYLFESFLRDNDRAVKITKVHPTYAWLNREKRTMLFSNSRIHEACERRKSINRSCIRDEMRNGIARRLTIESNQIVKSSKSCTARYTNQITSHTNNVFPLLVGSRRLKVEFAVHILCARNPDARNLVSLLCAFFHHPLAKFTSTSAVVALVFFMEPANYVRGKQTPIMLKSLIVTIRTIYSWKSLPRFYLRRQH